MVEVLTKRRPTRKHSLFQSAGRIIGWLKRPPCRSLPDGRRVSIRRADYWLVEGRLTCSTGRSGNVSIRRADYWLVEVDAAVAAIADTVEFQSAGRIIGWLKEQVSPLPVPHIVVSIRRADYWLVEERGLGWWHKRLRMFQSAGRIIGWLKSQLQKHLAHWLAVSIRRADYWLVEEHR